MNILATCVQHLRTAGASRWQCIADEIGVPKTTLRKIAYHDADNPGVKTCQAILDYFEAVRRKQRKLPSPAAAKSTTKGHSVTA